MSFKSPYICDRRIYDKKGKWKSPNNDIAENIFYFVREALTLTPRYNSQGQEELKPTITIVVFGGKPIAKGDDITLEDGHVFKVSTFTVNYAEVNVLIKDMLKSRIESIELVLE